LELFRLRILAKCAKAANELGRLRKAHLAQVAQIALQNRTAEVAATSAFWRKIMEEA
jgi:hypothetical protein